MRLPRTYHRIRAFLTGYFWLPCPRCGRMFGGHEKGCGTMWRGSPEAPGVGYICCPRCPETTFTTSYQRPAHALASGPRTKEEGT